jgi:ankyrin repeat protein
MRNEFTAVIEYEDDWYIGYCPEIPGANGQGRTIEECRASLADAISLILERGTALLLSSHEFIAAARDGDADRVRSCLQAGVDVNGRDSRPLVGGGNTALHEAANAGHVDVVRLLIANGADVNAGCDLGWTPLMRACHAGQLPVAAVLLQAGANPNLRNREGYSALGRTPGHATELVRLLQDWGAVV